MRVNTRDINSTSTVSSSSGRGHVESLFTNEEQKKNPRDVFDTFATHSALVHYVTDTDSWVEMAAATVAFLRNRVKNCFLFSVFAKSSEELLLVHLAKSASCFSKPEEKTIYCRSVGLGFIAIIFHHFQSRTQQLGLYEFSYN